MRLAVISARTLPYPIFWSNFAPALEDNLASQPDAQLILAPTGPRLRPAGRLPRWLSAVKALRRADAIFWIQMSSRPAAGVWATAYTRPTATRACLAFDAWLPKLNRIGATVSAQRLGTCFIPFKEAHEHLAERFPKQRWEWLPWAIDANAFADEPQERDVFAFYMGRRHWPLHDALTSYCDERGLRYEYSRPGWRFDDYESLARAIGRARYFVVTPPNLEDPQRTGPMSPFVMRYLEGLAGGCRLLGVMPNRSEYDQLLPADILVECAPDGSDLAPQLERAEADSDFDRRVSAARDRVLQEHSWDRRAVAIHRTLVDLA